MGKLEPLFTNRELSWLDFNARVLSLAESKELPLLERIKFLAIFHSNLDEFFMVRVANLIRRIELGYEFEEGSTHSNSQISHEISIRVNEFILRIERLYFNELIPELSRNEIRIVEYSELDDASQRKLELFFDEKILPVLTPLAVDPSHPFPHISGLSLNFGIYVSKAAGQKQFIRLKIPGNFSRFLAVHTLDSNQFVRIEEVIAANLGKLFPGAKVEEFFLFRVTRNQDLELDEDDENEDLLASMQEELERRRFGDVVRLEVENLENETLLLKLIEEFEIKKIQIYRVGTPLDLAALMELANFEAPALKYQPFQPCTHPRFLDLPEAEEVEDFDQFFERIRGGEVLLHHPYHSFSSSVAKFVELAARDPRVLAIKQTLYRTSGDSPIMRSLIEAAKNGKQVLAVIEIRARFDETANVRWAQKLEEAGVHVVYGLLGLKTHAKASLVLREEGDHLRRYSHIGTGNYHPRTARMYEDLGILSADEALGVDLSTLFNQLSGYAPDSRYSRLLVAPKFLRDEIQQKIERERENHLMGKSSRIRMKLNAIMDQEILRALYEAANAGVPIELNVRGICSFNMLSIENSARVKIRSILGRFLEHSRIYNFHNDGQEEYWIGSADMMDRNLNRRVETLVAATDLEHVRELDKILTSAFSDEYAAWSLEADNQWKFNDVNDRGGRRKSYQEFFMKEICP